MNTVAGSGGGRKTSERSKRNSPNLAKMPKRVKAVRVIPKKQVIAPAIKKVSPEQRLRFDLLASVDLLRAAISQGEAREIRERLATLHVLTTKLES